MSPSAQTTTTPATTQPAATKAPRRKASHFPRRRAGHKLEDEENESLVSDETFTDDSGISEDEDVFSEDETDEEYEDASDGEGRKEAEERGQAQNGKQGQAAGNSAKEGSATPSSDNTRKGSSANGRMVDLEVRAQPPVAAELEGTEAGEASDGNGGWGEGPEVNVVAALAATAAETTQDKKRREHEEYRKRRQEDPSFVPNRGRFFMHDHRDGTGSNGFRPFGPGGRGRGGRFGYIHAGFMLGRAQCANEAPSNDFQSHQQQPPPPELAAEWPHDMHEQIEQSSPRAPDQPRTFGRTMQIGTVQIQVNLPGMKAPITFSEVPCKVYTRLPFHRPPLRRDKPVRIALPDAPVRYIYPNVQRSFIFIPRAMRPGGSGYIRGTGGRGRGGYHVGGRSFYGGGSTIYSPSIGMSRRSSIEQQTKAITHGEEEANKPIAPTPRAVPQQPPPSYTPTVVPVPYRESRGTPKIPMFQPRPQQKVNVAEIDSPAVGHFPNNYNGGVYTEHVPVGTPVMGNGYTHGRRPSYPSQTSGTPLSNIPEAIHARPFQPNPYMVQQQYYNPYAQPAHGHPAPSQYPMAHPQMQPVYHAPPPPYVPGPSPVPAGAPVHYGQPMQPHHVPQQAPAAPGPTTIAQESNGMVYYSTWDPNAAYYQYPQANYGETPGMSMTPVPDGQGQNVGGTMYYYPPPQPLGPTGYYQ
ncbi:CASC3/Barentsz eIF4AIII binding-domain-containing protein [Pyronema domesticum]|nr:CASC3/Barentsz eIF4AIII binding-domain-containing protein [Pyronema domesticum]